MSKDPEQLKYYVLNEEQLGLLGKAACATWDHFQEQYASWVTYERAADVRRWRTEEDCTWRRIAEQAHTAWSGTWEPPSNQIAGMVLCDAAARHFGENYMEEPWN